MRRGFAAPRCLRVPVATLAALATVIASAQQPAPAPAPPAAAAPARPLPPMARPADPAVFPIRGFQLEGGNPLGEAAAQRVLAPYVRADATLQTLQQATSALEAALRAAGYGLHRVVLPPQEVGRAVRLAIVRFVVGRVDIEGAQVYDEGNIRRTLPELREGESPNFRRLAVQAAIANENPNKQVQVALRESEQPDRIAATISVREQRPWTLGLSASNAGSSSTGHDRVTLTAGHTNLFNRDHQLTGAYTTSLERSSDVRQFGVAWRVPLYAAGSVLGASYTRSDVVGNFGAFTSTGAGRTAGLNYTLYLPPQGGRRSYVSLGLDDRVFDAARINDVIAPGALDRRSRPVTLGYTARTETDRATWGYNAEIAANTGAGDHNDLASYQSEDPRVETVHWKALRGAANYTAGFARAWLWSLRTQFQYSRDVLISGEQFGLGGLGSVRGTEVERPISADQGLAATLEVSTPELASGLRAIAFVDAGWLRNNQPDGFNKPASDRLASVGLGLRHAAGAVAAALEYGRIVQGSRVPLSLNSNSPQRGDDRIHINVSVRF